MYVLRGASFHPVVVFFTQPLALNNVRWKVDYQMKQFLHEIISVTIWRKKHVDEMTICRHILV